MSSAQVPHANRLAHETSPYLLQHAHNPVDWYPWGAEALERARREERPIFLSIGYSACHWCHVMERESFESEAIAALLGRYFVCIKVDREERPDLDEIYMKAVQAQTGSGGWPMSVFLTPDLEPFFGGTYFPPTRMHGRPSFAEIVQALGTAWERERENVVKRGRAIAELIRRETAAKTAGEVDPGLLDLSLAAASERFDEMWGGFGGAPKFPHSIDIRLVLRHWLRTRNPNARRMVEVTLDRMARGGIYDQLGGGFHRYSTDEKWLIPHFEKMLYDNALLVPAYLEAHLAFGGAECARVARECCEWALREMTTPQGAFASAQDADSEGSEGKYFAWTPRELERVLGSKLGAWAADWFGVTDEGNFEHGASALWQPDAAEVVAARLHVAPEELGAAMEQARRALLEARSKRVPPMTDDKVLAGWNGLMISALAQCFQVLGDQRHLDAARRAARYVLEQMRREDGALLATARGGRAHLNAYLDDYAFVIQAAIDLYESDFDLRWLRDAEALERVVAERFEDRAEGGFFTTSSDHETLLARLKSPQDGALPAGAAVHALNLLRLAELTGRHDLAERAERTVRSMGALANRFPAAFSQLLIAVDFLAARPREIAIAGDAADPAVRAMLATVRRRFLPQRVVAFAAHGSEAARLPLFEGRTAADGRARAWVCRDYGCLAPVEDAAALARTLED